MDARAVRIPVSSSHKRTFSHAESAAESCRRTLSMRSPSGPSRPAHPPPPSSFNTVAGRLPSQRTQSSTAETGRPRLETVVRHPDSVEGGEDGSASPRSSYSSASSGVSSWDVRAAAESCRRMDGLVSFKDVQGLGAPPGESEEFEVQEAAGKKRRRWSVSQWLGIE